MGLKESKPDVRDYKCLEGKSQLQPCLRFKVITLIFSLKSASLNDSPRDEKCWSEVQRTQMNLNL